MENAAGAQPTPDIPPFWASVTDFEMTPDEEVQPGCTVCGAPDLPTTGHAEVCGRSYRVVVRKKDGTNFSTNGQPAVIFTPLPYHEAEQVRITQLRSTPVYATIEEVTP